MATDFNPDHPSPAQITVDEERWNLLQQLCGEQASKIQKLEEERNCLFQALALVLRLAGKAVNNAD